MTPEQKDRAKDLNLQRKYGITLALQNEMRQKQNNRCKTCGTEFTAENPPCTDHFHFFIDAHRADITLMTVMNLKWYAQGYDELRRVICVKYADTKAHAIADVRKELMPWAIRALLCRRCNRGLGYVERYFDATRHPERLNSVRDYLQSRIQKCLDNNHEIA